VFAQHDLDTSQDAMENEPAENSPDGLDNGSRALNSDDVWVEENVERGRSWRCSPDELQIHFGD
jgi:hypothetical protein